MKIILVIICWEFGYFGNLIIDIKVFRISLCWQFTCLHKLTWTFFRHIYWTILVYETLKICNLFDTPCTITLVFIQESMNRVHNLIVKLRNCELNFKIWFHFINIPVLPNQSASKFFFLRLWDWADWHSLWLEKSSACTLMLNLKVSINHSEAHMLPLAPAGPLVKRPSSMEDKGCQC